MAENNHNNVCETTKETSEMTKHGHCFHCDKFEPYQRSVSYSCMGCKYGRAAEDDGFVYCELSVP